MDKIGPATLQRIKTIKTKVEEVGRALGVPEEQALRYVEIDTQQRLADEICSLHDDGRIWHKQANMLRGVWKKTVSYLVGLLKAEE